MTLPVTPCACVYVCCVCVCVGGGGGRGAAEKVKKRRLEGAIHLADHHIPKSALFGLLPQPRPRGAAQGRGGEQGFEGCWVK